MNDRGWCGHLGPRVWRAPIGWYLEVEFVFGCTAREWRLTNKSAWKRVKEIVRTEA